MFFCKKKQKQKKSFRLTRSFKNFSRLSMDALIESRNAIERELSELSAWFAQSRFGLHGSLIDDEGYPYPGEKRIRSCS